VSALASVPGLRTGEDFKASLRDGRRVFVDGQLVDDVTTTPQLGPGIDLLASYFDAAFDPATRDIVTYTDPETGARVSRAWQAPTTMGELLELRRLAEFTSESSVGTFGRPPDLAPMIALGLLAHVPRWNRTRPDLAENVVNYIRYARANGLICAEVLSDPQTDRSGGSADSPGLLKIVETTPDGVYVTGAKSVGSLAAQANEIIFTNVRRPDYPPEALIQAAIPVATEGLTLVCREAVSNPGADPFDHPIGVLGEEADQLLIFKRVFIPNERIFNIGDDGQADPSLKVLWAHWQILTRLWVKARIFVGAAQAVVEALGTGKIPAVRRMVAEILQYEQVIKSALLSCEAGAQMTEVGILQPDYTYILSGRLYAVSQYPHIIHTLQELCGQGLVMRFPKAAFDHPEIGPQLDELLPGHAISAANKNRLMNFVWDLTSSSLAGRTELFENVNAGATPFIQERLYQEGEATGEYKTLARRLAGVPT
jgi:4-hydroxyphenylacetate 3-monooxygenase